MKIDYLFKPDEQLLIQKVSGMWSTPQYITYVNEVLTQPNMLGVKKILTDLRAANFENAVHELEQWVAQRRNMKHLDYLSVVLVNDPITTAITQLYQDRANQEGYRHRMCSTLEKALDILQLSISPEGMETILQFNEDA